MSDVYDALQSALNEHLEGMVVSFITVVEEIDEAGEMTLRVLKTQMTEWHAVGMLEYAKDEVHVPLAGPDEDFGD